MLTIKETADGLAFSIYVQPRSSMAAVVGCHETALKIKLTAPPVGGAANKQCIQILAKALGLPKSAITITSGRTSRRKQIRIISSAANLTPPQIKSLVQTLHNLTKSSA